MILSICRNTMLLLKLIDNKKNDSKVTFGINMGHKLWMCWIHIQNFPTVSMNPLDYEQFTKGIQVTISQMLVLTNGIGRWKSCGKQCLCVTDTMGKQLISTPNMSTWFLSLPTQCPATALGIRLSEKPTGPMPPLNHQCHLNQNMNFKQLFCLSVSGTFSLLW